MTPTEKSNAWPARDIFWLGYFGSGTPEGARYRNRSLSALGVLVVVQLMTSFGLFQVGVWRLAPALALGLMFGWIAWEWWRYIQSLDELARRLQVEAMAFTYIVGVFVMMALGGLAMAFAWKLSPTVFILLELVRAQRLAVLTRRY